jgi:hypothetical protein
MLFQPNVVPLIGKTILYFCVYTLINNSKYPVHVVSDTGVYCLVMASWFVLPLKDNHINIFTTTMHS